MQYSYLEYENYKLTNYYFKECVVYNNPLSYDKAEFSKHMKPTIHLITLLKNYYN